MSLVADYGSDSDNSQSSDEKDQTSIKSEEKAESASDEEEKKSVLPAPTFKFPTPTFSSEADQGSVFTNPFLEEENAKEAILQKHVKMINTKDVVVINGKKICWNYRKGRCRFGHNCKYAHDSDLHKTQEQLNAELVAARAQSIVCQSGVSNPSVMLNKPSSEEVEAIKEEAKLELTKKKRKRPGLSQGLVPGKKVMKQYLHNKS